MIMSSRKIESGKVATEQGGNLRSKISTTKLSPKSRVAPKAFTEKRKIADCKRKSCVSKPSKKQNTSRRTAATRATNSNVRRAIV